ncbi:Zona pellucida sperm-binding protein 2 [Merluccius polli]|uniref:Zona pellucida sperm-binding protein 2 n=1 Tax=Merluccius polli TaxID=89951 RepID=A0AA47MCN1_MERPO|nr:Zona pellucida sperm-binding protein 2 [Merluccius polli]
MSVVKVGTYYATPHGLKIVDLTAACPTGGVAFADGMISWNIPRYITPLLDGRVKILEMHMGINGQRLDKAQMVSRGYTMSSKQYHIVIELPIGSPDGYFKSHAPDYQYHLTYTVEPMLELLWTAKDSQSDTRYKVFFPITTPLMLWYPEIERMFKVWFGTLLHDVNLVNITFSNGVLSVAECNEKGFLQEQKYSNGSKIYVLQVPFSDDVVLKHNPEPLVTGYFLPLTYGFMVEPEQTPFSYSLAVDSSLNDVAKVTMRSLVLPSVFGTCDDSTFSITVEYGSRGRNFETMIGTQMLTPELGEAYGLTENGTHFSVSLPYTAMDIAFELFDSFYVKARLDLLLWEPNNNWSLNDFSLACNFPLTTTKCYSNGTMTALSMKVQSVPNLVPGQLTLREKSCKPTFSDDRFAYFSFNVNSCGTSRVFFENYLLYENEISLDYSAKAYTSPVEPEFRHTVSCYYMVNDTKTLTFDYKPVVNEPTAEIGTGQLMVQMRLALDESYELFYQTQDYPVQKNLRQPLYFEVVLLQSGNPQLELILDNCWATLQEERTSLPRWDIIVDSCENLEDRYVTIFHPVGSDSRVVVPSHFKRFSMKMFSFVKDEKVLKDQIYVHCDAVICDSNARAGVCSGQCRRSTGVEKPFHAKGQRVQRSATSSQWQISSGPILFTAEPLT